MGTNFYLMQAQCQHCGRHGERLHIGKRSSGWPFALHVDSCHRCLDEWVAEFAKPGVVIKNEYDDELNPLDMLLIIVTWGFGATRGLRETEGAPNYPTPPGATYRHSEGEFS